jgi:hypothetical protein
MTGQGVEPAEAPAARWWEWGGWGLPRSLDEVRFRDVAVILIVGFTIWGYVDVSRRGRIEPGHPEYHRTDVTVFTEAGAAFFDGRDPYAVTSPRGWNYLYTPLFALTVAPLSVLDTNAQVGVWFALSVACGFGCYAESRRLWRLVAGAGGERGPGRGLPLWVGVCAGAAVTMPTLDCLQRGQLGVALLYPLLLGLRLALGGRTLTAAGLGGVVLAWPVVVKLVPALPVGFLLMQLWAGALVPAPATEAGRRARRAGRAAAVTAGLGAGGLLFLLALPAACVGWGQNLRYLSTWANKVVTNADVGQRAGFHFDSVSNQSLGNAAHRLAIRLRGPDDVLRWASKAHWLAVDRVIAERRRADHRTRLVAQVAKGVVLVLLLALGVSTGWRGDARGLVATYSLACVATLLLSPLSWGHYYMALLPAVLFVPLWLEGRGLPRTARLLVACPAALTWAHYAAPRVTGAFGLLGLGTTLWFLAVCGLAIATRSRAAEPAAPDSLRADAAQGLPPAAHRQAPAASPVVPHL